MKPQKQDSGSLTTRLNIPAAWDALLQRGGERPKSAFTIIELAAKYKRSRGSMMWILKKREAEGKAVRERILYKGQWTNFWKIKT